MFTKLQQCSWIRKEVPHRCHVWDRYGLQEACGNNALLYQTVTYWMKPFARVRTMDISPGAKIVIHMITVTVTLVHVLVPVYSSTALKHGFVCQQDTFHKF
jgi:hypothetical protein